MVTFMVNRMIDFGLRCSESMNFYLVCSIDSNNVILIKLVNKIQIISVGFNILTIAMIYAQVLGNLNIDFFL